MDANRLRDFIKALADSAGFDRCGVTPAAPIGRADYLRNWLRSGRAGSMHYLAQNPEKRADPRALLPGAKSILVAALSYNQPTPVQCDPGTRLGRIARYAWGDDYHVVVKDKLFAMARRLQSELAAPFQFKVCVDTAPLLEREVAAAAGIGWIGKNTMVLDPRLGSYFFLGAMITTLDIEPDPPEEDHCGTCTACLDACPTEAFPVPYQMDASRCISYLTIEHRDEIPPSLQPKMGDWLFGCDICQEVCPYNRDAPSTREPRLAARPPAPGLPVDSVLSWTGDEYRAELRGTAMKRAKLDMLKRNAGIVLANVKST